MKSQSLSRSAAIASLATSFAVAGSILSAPSNALAMQLQACSSYVQSGTIADGLTGCLATVGGSTYTIKITDQYFTQNTPISLIVPLGNLQPWWQSSSPASLVDRGALAYSFADAVGLAFGTFKYQLSPEPGAPQKQFGGPLFAFEYHEDSSAFAAAWVHSNFNPSFTYPSVYAETDEYWTQHPGPGSLLPANGTPSFPTFRFAYAEGRTDGIAGSGDGGGEATANVPGPLPILGVAAAFGFSRKLRKRIKLHRGTSAVSTPPGA